jgi:hypothetical protein
VAVNSNPGHMCFFLPWALDPVIFLFYCFLSFNDSHSIFVSFYLLFFLIMFLIDLFLLPFFQTFAVTNSTHELLNQYHEFDK